MSKRPSRRGFLGIAAGTAAAVPVICFGYASAGDPGAKDLPFVTHPDHPDAVYPPSVRSSKAGVEPLNATVDCAMSGRRA